MAVEQCFEYGGYVAFLHTVHNGCAAAQMQSVRVLSLIPIARPWGFPCTLMSPTPREDSRDSEVKTTMIGFTFRQLEYFVATAEQGSVSAAARAKHISQPSVSLAISQLEAILGEKLFLRQASRGLELSPAGGNYWSRHARSWPWRPAYAVRG